MYKYEEVVALNCGICGFILNYGLQEERKRPKSDRSRKPRKRR